MRLAGGPYHPSAASRPIRTPQARMAHASKRSHQGEGKVRLAGGPYHPGAASRPMRTPQARMQVAACIGHAKLGNRAAWACPAG